MRRTLVPSALGLAAAAGLVAPLAAAPAHGAPPALHSAGAVGAANDAVLPVVSPTPQHLSGLGADVPVTSRVRLVVDSRTDDAARREVEHLLRQHGVDRIDTVSPGTTSGGAGLLTVRLGPAARPDIAAGLHDTAVPDHAEGYALRVSSSGATKQVVLGGVDADGQFYAAQTLRQLFRASGDAKLASVSVTDYPSMPLRGTIEGFYGPPWTPQERLDQMDFYGDVKANTYVYAPKNDPYHRDKWRQPYPAEKLAELGTLIKRAAANHVRFTFAVSPGESICYSSESDRRALEAKLQALYDLGTRSFSIPLDDINYGAWNCAGDRAAFGDPGRAAAARAQVDLLNDLQRNWIDQHPGTQPLQMVPTEYGDLTDTAYKQVLRSSLDPQVVVQWTGTAVVPPQVTNDQADAASKLFGRKVFLWDNYPVNDYGATAGRLLLAPYAKREAGLSKHLSGIVSNPMNQAYASKIAVFGVADFTWNDSAYGPGRDWPQAMSYLAHGDEATARALLVFGDLEHLAPTFGPNPWQPQAPELARRVAAFWKTWDAGSPEQAISDLRPYAERIASAPATIRSGHVADGFLKDAAPWLDATELWGKALVTTLDSLSARLAGDNATGERLGAQAKDLEQQAGKVVVDPVENAWGSARVRVGDGVLDTFVAKALSLAQEPVAVSAPAKVVFDADGRATVPVTVSNRIAGPATDVTVRVTVDGGSVAPETVDVGALGNGEQARASFTLSWPGAPQARAATLHTSVSWTTASGTASASSDHTVQVTCAEQSTRPVAVTDVDSQETAAEDGAATNAIDGDTSTYWHTAWSTGNPPPPHHITLDLGRSMDVCALRYLPRQDNVNGRVARYAVYLSDDGQTWGQPVATGSFANDTSEKWVPFAGSHARYVKFVALQEVNGNPWTSAAELSVDAR
ncbi:MAG TPA: beta-N-acetylglucosaminidase domain-containing protein [Segeticoccus sp.]|uniref:beta-N-acetylglucosaminidase domain-containing protein n=1 Tax=Segeticoccus sp. TaxID=2706531 RepID=UPI002D7E6B01|nr:beta-N-acetylglucosaminidase domain-containing protein [Segeticoccus sp.]HET8601590.1 beta-N-acetylglucosaminidase domain-containing protein [Segeticoccus sp.]